MSYSISTLLTRNLHEVFGENDPARRRAVETVSIPVRATMFSLAYKHFDHTLLTPCAYFSGFSVSLFCDSRFFGDLNDASGI
jgi:hypothetical protein